MLLLVVLYAGEPNSLRLVVGCGFVEGTQLLFFVLTNPFTDPWLDILQKAGSLRRRVPRADGGFHSVVPWERAKCGGGKTTTENQKSLGRR